MDLKLKEILSELRSGLEGIYGERLVDLILFGSQARGDLEDGSDIDVMVLLKGPVKAYEEIRRISSYKSELCLKHDVVITCIFMDEESFISKQGPLLRNVRREGMRI